MVLIFYNDLDLNQQSDLFSFLGDSLNENIFKVTTDNFKNAKDLDIEELKLANIRVKILKVFDYTLFTLSVNYIE